MNTNEMNANELTHLINYYLKVSKNNPLALRALPPIMIWSAPGIGKSTIIRNAATELGIGFIDVRLAQREPIDLRGLPIPDKEAGTTKWLVPEEWPRDPETRGILFFDELSAADHSLQVAAYEIILDRRLGNLYHVPDGWLICAAGNRCEDRAVAVSISSALANRLMHIDLKCDVDCWCKWALSADIHPAVIGFIRFRPGLLFHQENENLERGWPSPRTWEWVSAMMKASEEFSESELFKFITGLVGATAAAEFRAYISLYQGLGDVKEMMRIQNSKIVLPKKPDLIFAICAAMAHYLWTGTPSEEKALLDGFFRISLQLSSDFALMALTDALGTKDQRQVYQARCQKIFSHPQYKAWSKRHGAAFEKYQEESK